MTRSTQGFLEELLGSSRVSLSGKPKVDRGASGIDGTIQVSPVPALANVRFVDPPGAVGRFEFAPASLVQFGSVRCTQRQMVVWSAGRPRSMINSSTSRYESENRRYQRTAQTITSGSKCRHLNNASRGWIMGYTADYQIRSLSFCNTAFRCVCNSRLAIQLDRRLSERLRCGENRTAAFSSGSRAYQ